MRNRRLLAGVLCALFVVVLMASGLFVAMHAQHHCTGDHCPVCAVLCACTGLLRLAAASALLSCADCAALLLPVGGCVRRVLTVSLSHSSV